MTKEKMLWHTITVRTQATAGNNVILISASCFVRPRTLVFEGTLITWPSVLGFAILVCSQRVMLDYDRVLFLEKQARSNDYDCVRIMIIKWLSYIVCPCTVICCYCGFNAIQFEMLNLYRKEKSHDLGLKHTFLEGLRFTSGVVLS